MGAEDALGPVEFAVLDAVQRGKLRVRLSARQVGYLRADPAGEAILHQALRGCEESGLLQSTRERSGRRYELTPAGRARLRAERRLRLALGRLLLAGCIKQSPRAEAVRISS